MITNIRLQHFRSYADASFEFEPGVNIVMGPNASGKTNLLEAILVAARGGSYRARDGELVYFGRDWARVDMDLAEGGKRTVKLQLQPVSLKTFEIGDKSYKRLGLRHSLPVVLFEPNDLQLLSGSPERRREYLDDLLEQITIEYGPLRRQYRRTLAQRNALLKQPVAGQLRGQLFPWDVRLSHLAGRIVRARHELTERLNEHLPGLYKELSHGPTAVSMSYTARHGVDNYESQLLQTLEIQAELDRQRGFTGSGPHREDFVVLFDAHPAAESASRGEARTLVLALKILELQRIEQARGLKPLLLLDDVFSELDGARRRALTRYLSEHQTFITTTDADLILQRFIAGCNVIPLSPESTSHEGEQSR